MSQLNFRWAFNLKDTPKIVPVFQLENLFCCPRLEQLASCIELAGRGLLRQSEQEPIVCKSQPFLAQAKFVG